MYSNNTFLNKKYKIIDKIGLGTFGEVYKCQDENLKNYAVKKFTYKNAVLHLTTIREIKALKKMDHKNIIKIIEIFVSNYKINVVFPYYDKDLSKIKIKDVKTIICIIKQILEGVKYIHSLNYIHRDLKPANILIDNENKIKIIDFGMSREINTKMTENIVTLWYRAPEMLENGEYDHKIDLWSIGIMFLEFLLKKAPFKEDTEIKQLEKIKNQCFYNGTPKSNFKKNFIDKISFLEHKEKCLDLIEKILIYNKEKRITVEESLKIINEI